MLVHPLLRRFVVMSGGHCTYPTGGPAIPLKNKKTDAAQKAETVLSAVRSELIEGNGYEGRQISKVLNNRRSYNLKVPIT